MQDPENLRPIGGPLKTKALSVLRSLHRDESGQDLIEYALVAALMAFGAAVAMQGLANDINSAFSQMGSRLNSSIPT